MDSYSINYEELLQEEEINQSPHSSLYKGKYCGQEVAIKIITVLKNSKDRQSQNSVNSNESKYLEREIEIAKKIRQASIVFFIGSCVLKERNEVVFVTEFIEGGDLQENLLNQSVELSWHQKFKFIADVASALSYLHNRDIIFRDLKTKNILIDKSALLWRAKVTDFALARIKEQKQKTLMTILGLDYWLAPEILIGKSYDESADVFSYGIVLWEVISRKSGESFVSRSINGEFELKLLGSQFPKTTNPEFQEIAYSCCTHNPEERPTFKEIFPKVNKLTLMASKGTLSPEVDMNLFGWEVSNDNNNDVKLPQENLLEKNNNNNDVKLPQENLLEKKEIQTNKVNQETSFQRIASQQKILPQGNSFQMGSQRKISQENVTQGNSFQMGSQRRISQENESQQKPTQKISTQISQNNQTLFFQSIQPLERKSEINESRNPKKGISLEIPSHRSTFVGSSTFKQTNKDRTQTVVQRPIKEMNANWRTSRTPTMGAQKVLPSSFSKSFLNNTYRKSLSTSDNQVSPSRGNSNIKEDKSVSINDQTSTSEKKLEFQAEKKAQTENFKKSEPENIKKLEHENIKKSEPENIKKSEPEKIKKLEHENIKKSEPENIKKLEHENIKKLEPENIKKSEPENTNTQSTSNESSKENIEPEEESTILINIGSVIGQEEEEEGEDNNNKNQNKEEESTILINIGSVIGQEEEEEGGDNNNKNQNKEEEKKYFNLDKEKLSEIISPTQANTVPKPQLESFKKSLLSVIKQISLYIYHLADQLKEIRIYEDIGSKAEICNLIINLTEILGDKPLSLSQIEFKPLNLDKISDQKVQVFQKRMNENISRILGQFRYIQLEIDATDNLLSLLKIAEFLRKLKDPRSLVY